MVGLVLLQQEFDTLGQAVHRFSLLGHHRGQVEFQLADLDSHAGKIVLGGRIHLRRVQQGL